MVSNLTPAEVTTLLSGLAINQTVVFSMAGDERIVFNVTALSNGFIWKVGDTAIFQSNGTSPSGSDFKTASFQITNSQLYSGASSPIILPIPGVTPTDKIELITSNIYFLGDASYLFNRLNLETIGVLPTDGQFTLFLTDSTNNSYLKFSSIIRNQGFQFIAGAGLQLRANIDSPPPVFPTPQTVNLLYISYRLIP